VQGVGGGASLNAGARVFLPYRGRQCRHYPAVVFESSGHIQPPSFYDFNSFVSGIEQVLDKERSQFICIIGAFFLWRNILNEKKLSEFKTDG
jgi:hypothetical protein